MTSTDSNPLSVLLYKALLEASVLLVFITVAAWATIHVAAKPLPIDSIARAAAVRPYTSTKTPGSKQLSG